VDLLTHGSTLVVFPEGEVYRLNDRITPLLEGVAFMALTAQRELSKAAAGSQAWILPAAIRYRYVDDIREQLAQAMNRLEERILWKPRPELPLHERIVSYGEALLTIKEKEKFGHSFETRGSLPERIANFIAALLERLETEHLKNSPSAKTVPLRVKALRRHLLETWMDETAQPEARKKVRDALDDVQLALQIYSYPGDYVDEKPSVERMAETIEKFEEDIQGQTRPKGRRRARVILGEPINLSQEISRGRTRATAGDVTDGLEQAIQELMRQEA